ncbi:MAG: hypothetical protein NVS2B12_19950 [Ktedonobacteraceae bacterium]
MQNVGAEKLLEEIYQRMRQAGLLRGPDAEGDILILPTAARYSVSYKEFQEADGEPRTRSRERKRKDPVTKNQKTQSARSSSVVEEE